MVLNSWFVLSVALRKESVDRNQGDVHARRHVLVALRKESVDRNTVGVGELDSSISRSPQGERG